MRAKEKCLANLEEMAWFSIRFKLCTEIFTGQNKTGMSMVFSSFKRNQSHDLILKTKLIEKINYSLLLFNIL